MPKHIDPLARLLDELTEAQHAGCCDSDCETLQDIGEAFADFAAQITPMLARLSDGRMDTKFSGAGGIRRAVAPIVLEDILDGMIEGAVSNLDRMDLIKAAAAVRLARPSSCRSIVEPVAQALRVA